MASRDMLDGYVTELAYPTHFSAEMTPAWIAAALRCAGTVAPPERGPIRMLDLGCGDGIALAMIAASYPEGHFTGIDAMAAHVETGQAFAQTHGITNLDLRCQTFDAALQEAHDPYDYITCQGVIAWVSIENRRRALDFAGRNLARGGAFLVGYNAMPGWQDRISMQRMIRLWAEDAPGTATERYRAAATAVADLSDQRIAALPPERMEELARMGATLPADYFPHEYLNENWQPLWFADVAGEMAQRGLDYAGTTNFQRMRDDFCLRRAHREALAGITDPVRRETTVDLFCGTPFRSDLYVREAAKAEPSALTPQGWLAAATTPAKATFTASTPAGKLRFDNPAARAVLSALETGPRRIADIIQVVELSSADCLNAVEALLAGRHVHPASPPHEIGDARRMNLALVNSARAGLASDIGALLGTHGVVKASQVELLHAGSDPGELIAQAGKVGWLRDLLFDENASLDDPSMADVVGGARDQARQRLTRLGAVLR